MRHDFFFCLFRASLLFFSFFFNDTATTEIYTLSLHDALPTSSPTFVNVTMPVTWLPDFGSSCAAAFVTSCACAREPMAQKIAMQRIVFMSQTYRPSLQKKTLNRAGVARFRRRRQPGGRAKRASGSDARSHGP